MNQNENTESFEAEKMAFYAFVNENNLREESVKTLKYVLSQIKKKKIPTKKAVVRPSVSPALCETTSLEAIKKEWQKAQTKGLSQTKFVDKVNQVAEQSGVSFKRKFTRGVLSNILNNTKKPYQDVANFLNSTNIKY